MTFTESIQIEELLEAVCDLESGHRVETIIQSYAICNDLLIDSAYEAVVKYSKARKYEATASTDASKERWGNIATALQPCVIEIAAHMQS